MAQESSVEAEKAELEAIHELDLLTKDWNELPFASSSEIECVKQFQSYLSKTHEIDIKTLSPFEMAIFYFGCDGNKVIASNRYLEFLKFSESYKFDTISKESLIKSKTLLRKAYTLGGVIDVAKPNNNNNNTNNNDKNGSNNNNNNIVIRKCHLCASVGKHIIPSEFDSVNSMIKGFYYNWNELNYWTNFGLSKNYMIIISNLGEIGMKNFSIYGQIAALNLMQHIYPIKIERIYMYDAPLIMQTVVKMIIKLIDVSKFDLRQLNKNKIFKQIDDDSQIPMSVGGKYDFIKQVLKIKYSNNGDTGTEISCKN